ncbi:serine/threonine-protein kinase [Amycolatopsis sp. H20-H5]|uniref:serine/threonine-protein kinase n=1 Tax=Amycolatopsis sp. H20-H5 TaxID=3046309 RepID=UPI002DB6191F|nr:serine/threonine-protein kinase [Amycolatopsis sp. H20-H5]MEC3981968.1 serine/threonine-protein kinase [Amycolatopsis sp. H20-H5]
MTDEHTRATERTRPGAGPRLIAGRYVLLGELGRGGMGVVWRAQDQVIGRDVAIKELKLDGPEQAGVLSERVLREVRAGGRLNDPAVVTVFDVITEAGTTYIVMELVEAPTLADLVRERGPLPARQVAQVGERVLQALRAAHAAGIVHRDVKPANIMVAPDGRVKLTDFGIAHAIDDPRLTTSGMIVGSPAFMAPERVRGREAMPESDLWSLGVTLFFAVEGVVAFERPTTAATLHAIMTEVPYLTRGQGPLAAAILGLLVATPEARMSPDQAHGLLAMAAQQATGTPPRGHTASLPQGPPQPRTRLAEAPKSPSRHRPLWVSLAAVAVLGALVGGLFLGRSLATPEPDAAMLPTVTFGVDGFLKAKVDDYQPCYNVAVQQGVTIAADNNVNCDKNHTLEVYDTGSVLATGTNYSSQDATLAQYPGVAAVTRLAEARCAASFHSTVVPEDRRAALKYRALIPTEAEWKLDPEKNESPTRVFHCVLMKSDNGQMPAQIQVKVK